MRWTPHPGRTLLIAPLLAMLLVMPSGIAGAQPGGTPSTPTDEVPQSIWQTLDGVERAIVRTWSDLPGPGTPSPESPTLRFVTGLVVQFDDEENAAASLVELRDWMVASLQVNLVDVDLSQQSGTVSNLGDEATAANATGTVGETPLTVSVIVVRDGDRVLAVGGSVMSDEELLTTLQGIVTVMTEREPDDNDVEIGEMGRFTGGDWAIFPEEDDPTLEDMRWQGDLPIYNPATPTPAG